MLSCGLHFETTINVHLETFIEDSNDNLEVRNIFEYWLILPSS